MAQYPNIKIIASQTGHGYRLEGTKVMENYLERFPAGSIDIVYTHSDEMALGALQAIKAAGRTELVGRIVTIDGQRAAIKAVVDGELLAVADYAPHFGEAAFRTILEYLEGKEVAPVQMLQFNMYHMQTAEGKAFTTNYYNRMLAGICSTKVRAQSLARPILSFWRRELKQWIHVACEQEGRYPTGHDPHFTAGPGQRSPQLKKRKAYPLTNFAELGVEDLDLLLRTCCGMDPKGASATMFS